MLCLAEGVENCAALFGGAGSRIGLIDFFKQFRLNTGYLTDFLQCVPVIMLGKKIQNTVRILK